MSTRAKFRCGSVTKTADFNGKGFTYAAKFWAVTGNSEENKKFFASTPSGEISVSTIVSDKFIPGKEYYVDFTGAENE